MSKLTVAPESDIGMLFHVLGYMPAEPFEITIESPDYSDPQGREAQLDLGEVVGVSGVVLPCLALEPFVVLSMEEDT